MITYKINHVNGLYFELTGDEGKSREYEIQFIERNTNKIVFETKLKLGMYARLQRRYLSDIIILIRYEGRTLKQVNLLDELKAGSTVIIHFKSSFLSIQSALSKSLCK